MMKRIGLKTMKRIGLIACLAIGVTMMASGLCFGAEKFQITSTYPEDGASNTTKDNMCVKVYFSTEVGNEASRAANKGEVKITDEKGKSYPCDIYYSDKNAKYALILIDTNKVKTTGKGKYVIKDNAEYTCTISDKFVDNNGNRLGDDPKRTITFKTINQGRNTIIYMVLMFVMFGGMMFFSMRQQKKAKEKEKDNKETPFNPYAEAKRTGKSVDEVIAKHEKDMEKKNAARKLREKKIKEEEALLEEDNGNYRVAKPLRIADAGAKYKSGRAALAKEKEAEEAAKKAERKAQGYTKKTKDQNQSQGKGKGKGKKKK